MNSRTPSTRANRLANWCKAGLLGAALALAGGTVAQTTLIDEGFEGAPTWTLANTADNFWVVGTATNNGGISGAYISNDGGVTNAYTITTAVWNHLYWPISVPAGESAIVLSFDFRGVGEFDATTSSWDYMRVSVTSAPPTAGTAPGTANQLPYIYAGQNDYTKFWVSLPASLAGAGTRYLVFTWRNDASLGNQTPAAIDNVKLVSDVPNPLSGTKSIPGDYSSIGEAIAQLNAHGANTSGGSLVFNVAAGSVFNETPMPLTTSGSSATNRIVFQKSGAGANPRVNAEGSGNFGAPSIGSVSSTSDGIIVLNGCDFVTFNGIDLSTSNGLAADPFMAIEYGYLLRNNRSSTGIGTGVTIDGAQNNIIENCTVTLNRDKNASGSRVTMGILQTASTATGAGSTPTLAAHANSGNTYRDFSIRNAWSGVNLVGNATVPDIGCAITSSACGTYNSIGDPTTANDIGSAAAAITAVFGIRAENQSGVLIENNSIRNLGILGSTQIDGINVLAPQGTSTFRNNIVRGVRNNSTAATSATSGMRYTHPTSGTHALRIYNNAISEITSGYTGAATATRALRGILIAGTGGTTAQNYEIWNNTVSINGSGSLNLSSACLEFSTTAGPVYTVRNNILANYTGAQTGVARHYGVFHTSATAIGNTGTAMSHNDIFIQNDAGTTGFTALGNATTYNGVAAWQTAVTQATSNAEDDPQLTNIVSDLHSNALANASGTAVPGYITVDLDCAGRLNHIGAYNIAVCSSATAGTVTGTGSACFGVSNVLSLTGATTGAGITYQWAYGSVGGPHPNLLGTASTQNTNVIPAGNWEVVCTVTCAFCGPCDDTTTPFGMTINALPLVTVSPSSATFCYGDSPIALTASGAVSYTWSPAAGLSATTGATVSASPVTTTTYTATGTDGLGCVGTGTSTITVPSPSFYVGAATATPATICSGGTSTLNVTAGTTGSYTVSSIPFGLLTSGSPTTVFSTGDDAVSSAITLPFPFEYFGTLYTQVFVYTNGWLQLGTSSGSTTSYSESIPTAAVPQTLIAGLKDDLNVVGGGTVTRFTNGTPGNRVFVVSFNDVKFFNSGANNGNATFQIQLYEEDMRVEVHVADATDPVASAKTIGIENATGTVGFTPPGRNNVTFDVPPATPEAWRFQPSGGTLNYSWAPAVDVVSPSAATTATNPLATTTNFTVTVDNGSCFVNRSVTVTVNPAITAASVTPASPAFCTGGSVNLTAVPADGVAPYTYQWFDPSSNPAGTAVTQAANLPGVWSVDVTDACGGTASASSDPVVENPLPAVVVSPASATYCAGGPAISLTASGAVSYTWSPAAGLSATTGATVSASPVITTTYTATGTDVNGCQNTASSTITYGGYAPVISSVTATPSAICSGDNSNLNVVAGDFTANPTGGSLTIPSSGNALPYPSTVSVSGLAGVISNIVVSINNLTHTWPNDIDVVLFGPTGAHSIIFTDAIGGSGGVSGRNYTFEIGAPPLPITGFPASGTYGVVNGGAFNGTGTPGPVSSANLGNFLGTAPNGTWSLYVFDDTSGDVGTIGSWSLTITTGAPVTTYSWTPATFLSSTTVANPTATAITTLPITYTVTVASATGCSASDNVIITEDATDTDGDSFPDCTDTCPTVPGQVGDACDDGNPSTVLDVLGAGPACSCAGTPCTTDLDLVFQPDGVSDIGWELRQQGTNILVQSGGGVYPASPGYSVATCLPNGCFYLVVTDDLGDGITDGGYLLKINSAERLIDNLRDAFGRGGFTSGFTSQIAAGEGFCLPIGTDRLIFTSCDRMDWRLTPCNNEYVVANDNPAVTAQYNVNNATSGYQMWWYNPNGGYSFKRIQYHNTANGLAASATRACHFRFNNWSGNQLAENVLYNVKVRGIVNGVFQQWGAACRFMINSTEAQCARTKLNNIPGNANLTCGQFRAIGTSFYVHALPVRRAVVQPNGSCTWQNANRYQFRFRIVAESFELVKTSATGQYFVNTVGLTCGKTYEVDVRASFDNGATWCHTGSQWGDICLLNTVSCLSGGNPNMATEGSSASLRMYPNPNRGDQLFVNLEGIDAAVETVSVDIFDAFGKRVSARTIGTQDGMLNTILQLNGSLAAGLYTVSITAGEQQFTERLVVQP